MDSAYHTSVPLPFPAGGSGGKRPLELAPERKVLVSAVAFYPHQRRIAFGYRDGATFIIGFRGAPQVVAEPDGELVTALAWSPYSALLIGGGESGRVFVARPSACGRIGRLFC